MPEGLPFAQWPLWPRASETQGSRVRAGVLQILEMFSLLGPAHDPPTHGVKDLRDSELGSRGAWEICGELTPLILSLCVSFVLFKLSGLP